MFSFIKLVILISIICWWCHFIIMNIGCIRKSQLNLFQILTPMKKLSWTEKIIQTLLSLFSASFQTNHIIVRIKNKNFGYVQIIELHVWHFHFIIQLINWIYIGQKRWFWEVGTHYYRWLSKLCLKCPSIFIYML